MISKHYDIVCFKVALNAIEYFWILFIYIVLMIFIAAGLMNMIYFFICFNLLLKRLIQNIVLWDYFISVFVQVELYTLSPFMKMVSVWVRIYSIHIQQTYNDNQQNIVLELDIVWKEIVYYFVKQKRYFDRRSWVRSSNH